MSKTENQSPTRELGNGTTQCSFTNKTETSLPNTFHTTTARSFCPTSLPVQLKGLESCFISPKRHL